MSEMKLQFLPTVGRHLRLIVAAAPLAMVALVGFTGSAAAQPSPWPLGSCVRAPNYEALQPSSLYYTNGPGTFGRDTTTD
jgi:hypothetical protein